MGAVFQIYQGRGARGVWGAFREPGLSATVTRKLWGRGLAAQTPSYLPDVLVTNDGRVYDTDTIARLAQQEGLNTSFIGAETTRSLVREIRDLHPHFWRRQMGQTGESIKLWQQGMIDAAQASDNFARVGVFIDALRRGDSPTAAAGEARRVGYDYGSLTDFEKNVLRHVVMFYSFMRRNQDLFWNTLMTKPHRVMGQMRLLRDLHRLATGDDDPEIVEADYLKHRMPIFWRAHKVFRETWPHVLYVPPPLPVTDGVLLPLQFAGWLRGDPEAFRSLVARTSPVVQAPFVKVTGEDVWSGADLARRADVPAWFVTLDRAWTGGSVVDGYLGVRPEYTTSATRQYVHNIPYVWKAQNGWGWWLLRTAGSIVPGMGRNFDTISRLDRANAGPVEAAIRWSERLDAHDGETHPTTLVPKQMDPRHGLTGLDEGAGFFGVTAHRVHGEVAATRAANEASIRAAEEATGLVPSADSTQ